MALLLLLDVPTVQNFVAHKAADFASKKLETRVSIDRLNISLPNKVNVYGFYVEDYQQDTLLYVGRLRANLRGVREGISFGSAKADVVKLNIVQAPSGDMNIKEVVDHIGRKEEKSAKFKLSISEAEVMGIDLRIERQEHRNPEFGVDYSNMQLLDIRGKVSDLNIVTTLAGAVISGDIETLGFHERSGLVVDDITGFFKVDKGLVALDDVRLLMGESDIRLDSFSITGGEWDNYRDFVHKVRIDAVALNSTVSSEDVGYFAPALRRWQTSFSQVDMSMHGTVSEFTGEVSNAVTQGGYD